MVGIRADRLPAQGNCDIKADVRRLRGLAAAGTCHEIADDSDDDRLRYFVVGQVRKILAERKRSACGRLDAACRRGRSVDSELSAREIKSVVGANGLREV